MQTAAASTDVDDAREAGRQLSAEITRALGREPQALMVFVAPSYDHSVLLDELAIHCPSALVVGASSAGEFMNHKRSEGLACALGLAGDDVRFGVGVARDVAGGAAIAARQALSRRRGVGFKDFRCRQTIETNESHPIGFSNPERSGGRRPAVAHANADRFFREHFQGDGGSIQDLAA